MKGFRREKESQGAVVPYSSGGSPKEIKNAEYLHNVHATTENLSMVDRLYDSSRLFALPGKMCMGGGGRNPFESMNRFASASQLLNLASFSVVIHL